MASETDTGTPPPGSNIVLDKARVEANANLNYNRAFWSGYKLHVHSMLTGGIVGLGAGTAIGLVLFPFLGPVPLIASASSGLLMGAEGLGGIGNNAGARAATLAEKHARIMDPANKGNAIKTYNDKLMYDGRGHHHEFPVDRDKNKFFSWKSGFTGAVLGVATGALLGVAGIVTIGVMLPAATAVLSAAIGGALMFGIFGLTYGIERSIFKSLFNKTDSLLDGSNSRDHVDLGLAQSGKHSAEELLDRRQGRQEVIQHLQEKYNEEIFRGGVRGYLKGAFGGAALGTALGAGAGLLAVGMLAFTLGPAFIAAWGMAILGTCTVAGIGFFGKTFSDAGANAGVQTTASAIDDEFHIKYAMKEKGTTEALMQPQQKSQGIFNSLFDNTLNLINAVTKKTGALYHHVYAGDAVMEDMMKVTDASGAEIQPGYGNVTFEDAKELDRKLSARKEGHSFEKTYLTQQEKQSPPAIH